MDNCTKFQRSLFPPGFRQEIDGTRMLSDGGEWRQHLQRCPSEGLWDEWSEEYYQPPREKAVANPQEPFAEGQLRGAIDLSGSQHEVIGQGRKQGTPWPQALSIASPASAGSCLTTRRSQGEGCSSIPFIQSSQLRHPGGRRMGSGPGKQMGDDQQTPLTKNLSWKAIFSSLRRVSHLTRETTVACVFIYNCVGERIVKYWKCWKHWKQGGVQMPSPSSVPLELGFYYHLFISLPFSSTSSFSKLIIIKVFLVLFWFCL